MRTLLAAAFLLVAAACRPAIARSADIALEAERPALQRGSVREDAKSAASGGHVLGGEWGGAPGDFAEYAFDVPENIAPARIRVRYARALPGASRLLMTLDGAAVGTLVLPSTGGWGEEPGHFRDAARTLPRLAAGRHHLRLAVAAPETSALPEVRLKAVPVLELVGNRADKNSVGGGKNVALYTGKPSRFFYATHELGDIFSAADGATLGWYPDHVAVSPQGDAAPGNVNLDRITIGAADAGDTALASAPEIPDVREQRLVCVTSDDVIVSRVHLSNPTNARRVHRIVVTGDCRGSFDWRGRPGGEKTTRRAGDTVVMTDRNVFPEVLPGGLAMAVGGNVRPAEVVTDPPGAYRMTFEIAVPARSARTIQLACAVDRDAVRAGANLAKTLAERDPLATNRESWRRFYERDVPRFECSDPGLNELYAFRWFLLRFSTAGGDLGLFQYPVVMEGRQAFQTYCCYSAPFMAFDMNWRTDALAGFGHIANMLHVAYPDGRFPWYASPRTNDVPLEHPSKTGLSLLPWTAWRFYQTHGRPDLLRPIYPGLKKNLDWWIHDRDPDNNGLFSIDHQLETGMDDLHRRWTTRAPRRYEAVDATAYAVLNLRAVANLARALGERDDAARYAAYADRSSRALRTLCWDSALARFRDRNPDTGELSDYNSITIFYPLFAGVADAPELAVIRRYLLNPSEYWTAHPIPALSQSDPEFDPVRGYWRGPSWPAANSHVIEGFASTAKRLDRTLLPEAAELLKRAAANHLQPRADFYERYDPFTGRPLSAFRDYMHSWWIDILLRHIAGLTPQDDGSLVIDPLPMGLSRFAVRGAPHRGHRVDVLWNASGADKGLTVRLDGTVARRDENFQPGRDVLTLPAARFAARGR